MTELSPPPEITPELFRRWRDARRGETVAEDLSNPYWAWLVRSQASAWAANQYFGGPSSVRGEPAWSADRFGQSETVLPDGRTVLVAGEHEDYYDPDFFIYNDVIIHEPDGAITILGYPSEVFEPTDFHSATLLEGELLLVGNLGYMGERRIGETALLRLDLGTWEVRTQAATGEGPGWIHRHEATLEDDALLITGGLVQVDETGRLMENIDDYRLVLGEWRWERLTERDWPLIELVRVDGERTRLWEMRQALWYEDHGGGMTPAVEYPMPEDRAAFEALYRPPVDHRALPEDDDYRTRRIEVEGVVVRYEEDQREVTMTVEGELPEATIEALQRDLLAKLRQATGAPYAATRLRGARS